MPPPPPQWEGRSAAMPGRDNTTLYGVLGIVLGLCFCGLFGVLFGVLSIRAAKQHFNSPVLGYIAIALGVVNLVVNSIFAATGYYTRD
jgi:ABC-type uncharacterized transport system permease subunit